MKYNALMMGCVLFAAQLSMSASVYAADRRVVIVNNTGVPMTNFYASASETNDWEEDILGRDILDDGEEVRVNIDDGSGECMFDFKGVFKGGQSVVKKKIDVCHIGKFTFNP
jgi:hypothetical protein